MTRAVLFPGQGAQFCGMGADWVAAFPLAREMFQRADAALGFSLGKACWEGEEEVHRTDVSQPGILTTSAAILTVLRDRGVVGDDVQMTAGLSLGEYTALWFAGCLGFEDAVRLVRLRGEAMQAASDQGESSMTSLLGATEEVGHALAAIGSEHGICTVANLNAPGQVVLSGEVEALAAVEEVAREHGVRRAVRLKVAGGFHSECMRPAALQLGVALDEVDLQAPRMQFLSNVTGDPTADVQEIRENLKRQVCAPVLWEKSMRWALGEGIDSFLEPGPGDVLGGIMRKIDREAPVQSVQHPGDIEECQ